MTDPAKSIFPDFVKLFYNRLATLANSDFEKEFLNLSDHGLVKLSIKLFISALFFMLKPNSETGIWILESKNITYEAWPHEKLREPLYDFLTNYNLICRFYLSIYIIKDTDSQIYLYYNRPLKMTPVIKYSRDIFLDLISAYNLDGCIEAFKNENSYLLGKIREDHFLTGIAVKHDMTNIQYARFKAIIRSARKTNSSISYYELAREIVEEK